MGWSRYFLALVPQAADASRPGLRRVDLMTAGSCVSGCS